MDRVDLAEEVTGLVVGLGVNKIVATVIKNNVVPQNNYQKAIIFAGSVGITWAVNGAVRKETDRLIDALVSSYNQVTGSEDQS